MILDTIVAPATPLGRSALAIVRIDGPRAEHILQDLTRSGSPEVRRATHVQLHELDDAVAIRYQ
ncbi:MAG TPA: tRNA uridine-5-carboxymethylaminomethyl(34) synthesis GTPase MnmE, partial [Thermoanaerobaculia bacterium]